MKKNIFNIVVIGAGPAGMMAAISAKGQKNKVALLEKNKNAGRKLLLTGKGRCNVSNIKEIPEIIAKFGKKGRFLYSALTRFSNADLINFLESRGVKTKVERSGRVFPVSDKAETVLNCLLRELRNKKVKVFYEWPVTKISRQKNGFKITSANKQIIFSRKVILATGGKSYPGTGSTGDGYRWLEKFGHKILPLQPALASLIVKDEEIRSLSGLSLKNVRLYIFNGQERIINFFGEMLFTHSGISGPMPLKSSKIIYPFFKQVAQLKAIIDLKPALSKKQLKKRIYREISQAPKKEYQSLLKELLPKSLIPLTIKKTGIGRHKKNSLLSKEEISRLLDFLKNFNFLINAVAPIETAIITSGGIDLGEINSKTMESLLVSGFYVAGEIISVDGPTGGFNLQKAFSTGHLAGEASKNSL